MLSNFVQANRPLLQSFLLGQPEFRRTLQGPDMEQLRQRVIASYHLGPLDAAGNRGLHPAPAHRLRAGKAIRRFSPDAFAAIHEYTGGIPRRINILCDRLMLLGCVEQKHALTGCRGRGRDRGDAAGACARRLACQVR